MLNKRKQKAEACCGFIISISLISPPHHITMNISSLVLLILSASTWDANIFGTRGVSYVAAEYQHEHHHNEVHPRLDYYDPLTKKMKPVRSVVEDDMTRDFPRIIDCGPDETQNAYEGDPDDCKGFFFCDGKFYIHRRCGPGLLFDRLRGACDWPENVDCDDRPLPWNFAEYQGVSAYHHYKPRKT